MYSLLLDWLKGPVVYEAIQNSTLDIFPILKNTELDLIYRDYSSQSTSLCLLPAPSPEDSRSSLSTLVCCIIRLFFILSLRVARVFREGGNDALSWVADSAVVIGRRGSFEEGVIISDSRRTDCFGVDGSPDSLGRDRTTIVLLIALISIKGSLDRY
jgi:hypothetical protein